MDQDGITFECLFVQKKKKKKEKGDEVFESANFSSSMIQNSTIRNRHIKKDKELGRQFSGKKQCQENKST